MHILHIFTIGHFFSINTKKWFKLFYGNNDIKSSVLIQEPSQSVAKRFYDKYGDFYNVLYFQKIENLLKKNYLQRFYYLKSIARIIDEQNPDIVHVHGLYSVYFVLPLYFMKIKPKIITHVWGSDINYRYKQYFANRILTKWLFKKSSLIWVNWLAMADNLRINFSKYSQKIRTIPLGVSNDIFQRSSEKNRNSIQEKFNLQNNEYLIIYTRGFKMNSNYHKIIEALERVEVKAPYKVIFHHFIANPKMDDYLNRLIKEKNLQDLVVISHDNLSDNEIKALYELADLAFLVTTNEQFSRTIHESILSSTNLILNNIEPYQYLKYFFNWNVDLVNVDDTLQLAKKIEYYINTKPNPDWEYERLFIEKMFKFEDKSELIKNVYTNLIQ